MIVRPQALVAIMAIGVVAVFIGALSVLIVPSPANALVGPTATALIIMFALPPLILPEQGESPTEE